MRSTSTVLLVYLHTLLYEIDSMYIHSEGYLEFGMFLPHQTN